MRISQILFLLLIACSYSFSQELPAAYRAYNERYPEGPVLNRQDSLFLMNIPEKKMPAQLRGDQLPPLVDNSNTPYLRPVFEQQGPSCGQAAMVGYNFTYEMAYRRNQPAQFPQTQYPSHFTWNFQNGGNGWYGVSYFHSIEILRLCGCMNSEDYGGYYDDGMRWIDGYEMYYNGMSNRVKGVYSINTSTAEGIMALKSWLYDHMGEGNSGGVASYYANTPWNATILNDTTPEGGKHVVIGWYPQASHAMTIVGYNDSIRYDYNDDGLYTNTIDLNEDGILDPRDWEIGAVKFVNSHGLQAQDSGFCYMMYKCLSETFDQGGVWNQSVHILDIDENYQPIMTYKVTLKHNRRVKVKVLAGVSRDTSDVAPEWIMDFPIIDYQGSNHYMQGQDTADYLKYLEFGLDVTPLLSYLQPGEPAKFFFIVDENDPAYEGDGEITSFSVMDYTAGVQEIISDQVPLILENNSRTLACVIHVPDFDNVEITTGALPPFTAGEPYIQQLQAGGGTSPYLWDMVYHYRVEQSQDTFPTFHANQVLYTSGTDSIMPVPLGFSFPFYGKFYDTVYMHINGHLQFDRAQLPWPYMLEPVLHFRSNRIIAPMTNESFTIIPGDGDGGWADINDTAATFRWKLSWNASPGASDLNFAVRIKQTGDIEFIYGQSTLDDLPWLGGISAGNKKDYIDSPVSGSDEILAGKKISFLYLPVPAQLDLSDGGLLTGFIPGDDFIYDLSFRVKDRSGLSSVKTLQMTSGPYLDFTVHAGGNDQVDYGDTVMLDLEISNDSADTLYDTSLELMTGDPYIGLTVPVTAPGTILPGQVITIPDAFSFIVSVEVPDQRDLLFAAELVSTSKTWHKDLIFKANAPNLQISKVFIDDEDGRLDPGDIAPMMITYRNSGHASIDSVSAELFPLGPEVQVVGNPVQLFGLIGKGASVTRPYILKAEESTPDGFTASFVLSTVSAPGLQQQDSIDLKIGRIPVLVIDMDPNNHSGPVILSRLNELNVLSEYEYTIPALLVNYKSLFICLGYHNSNHVLTSWEGQQLAEFLDNGGRIYMEGRKTWRDDPGTPVQPKFSLSTNNTVGVYDTITGINGTFAQGLNLVNQAVTPFSFYYLEPVPPAFNILQDNNNLQSCAIAYDSGIYKTIGALFEYGTMTGIPQSASRDLLLEYLEFFDIEMSPVSVEERPEEPGQWIVYPNPAGGQLTVGSRQSEVGSQQSVVRLVITDLYGRKLKEFDHISSFPYRIDISDLRPGMYIIRIVAEDGHSGSVKFLKVTK